MEESDYRNTPYWKLLYDAECKYCTTFAVLLHRFDRFKQIEITSLQEYSDNDRTLSRKELLQEVHLLGRNKEILRGERAVEKIISIIPRAKPLRWMIESRWGKKGTAAVYRSIKRFRHCSRC